MMDSKFPVHVIGFGYEIRGKFNTLSDFLF